MELRSFGKINVGDFTIRFAKKIQKSLTRMAYTAIPPKDARHSDGLVVPPGQGKEL